MQVHVKLEQINAYFFADANKKKNKLKRGAVIESRDICHTI